MKLSVSDGVVSVTVIALVCVLLWLFAIDIGTISVRAGEEPLGTVIFKKLTATRRPSDGLGWERMKNNSPVYDSDTLRTGDFSEAAVYFDDGTSLELEENSMLRLDFGSEVKNLEFLDGEITVGGSAKGSNYAISSKAGTITVGKDSSATFSRNTDAGTVSVEVNKGDATLVRADGSTQKIAENQALEVNLADGQARFASRPLLPVKPVRNARILSLKPNAIGAEGPAAAPLLDFEWKLESGADPEGASYSLEIAMSKDFSDGFSEYAVKGLSTRIPVSEGTWYWKVRDAAGKESPVRKFSLASSVLPRPAFPADGTEYGYRKTKPEIRFAWTGMEEASSYLFELSGDASFANPRVKTRVSGTNLSVNNLDEGLWYWRINPIHGFTEIDGSEESVTRTVRVVKNGAMEKTDVTTPFAGTLYQIQEIDEKGLSFAWIPEAEAVSYELVVSNNANMSSSALTVPTTVPYARLTGSACGPLAKSGTWYWSVRWLDKEGNRSPDSAVRPLVGVDGSIAIRAVFPPDGYRIADSLASNARFSWKSNIAARTVFIVSHDADFTDILYQETVTADTVIGKAWNAGTYYWKLRTLNADGSVFLETAARSFDISEPLPGPSVIAPAPGIPFYLRDGDRLTLKWNPVKGADYYTVGVYSSADGYASPVYERAHLETEETDMNLGDFPSGTYLARIQGFALASDESTRIIGYIGESPLSYRRIEYLAPGEPANETVFDGLDAWRKGVTMTYKTANVPDAQEFMLWRDAVGKPVGMPVSGAEIARGAGKGNAFLRKKLPAGKYWWTVTGNLAGFDISAKERFGFTVLPIPPLPETEIIEPARGAVFGSAEIRANRSITFRWIPVAGANRYALSVFPSGSSIPSVVRENITGTEFVLNDLSSLSRGSFIYRIEARSYDSGGDLEQAGVPAESDFTIDLPAVKRAMSTTGDKIYGR